MEAFAFALIILVALTGLAAFGLAAIRYGVDSRGTVGDDHARRAGF